MRGPWPKAYFFSILEGMRVHIVIWELATGVPAVMVSDQGAGRPRLATNHEA